jgi:predicted glycoside hydrolase/deacetylase ChbG (UPF0249 family)
MQQSLIITADDYGMCEAVNRAIEECIAAGAVQATCVMTNMPAFRTVETLKRRFPQSSLGIHWTLTEGRPILSAASVTSLLRGDGSFHSPSELRRRWLRRQIKTNEITAELRAQYRLFRETAGEPEFWNTHQNFHVWPGLFDVCVGLGQELGIPSMRCHRRITVPLGCDANSYNIRHPISWFKAQMINRWAKAAESHGVRMPAGLLHAPGYGADAASLEEIVMRLPWNSVRAAVELIVHPATTSEDPLFHRNAQRRLDEYLMFKDPRLGDRLDQLGVKTVGFTVLNNGS